MKVWTNLVDALTDIPRVAWKALYRMLPNDLLGRQVEFGLELLQNVEGVALYSDPETGFGASQYVGGVDPDGKANPIASFSDLTATTTASDEPSALAPRIKRRPNASLRNAKQTWPCAEMV